MDPRTTFTLKARSKKAVHIKQFLTEKCKKDDKKDGRNVS
jgi:hypothetical protein